MRRATMICMISLAGLVIAGCTPDPITLTIAFPNEESFLYSSSATITAFDLGGDERGVCTVLLRQLLDNVGDRVPSLESGAVPVCDLRDGGFTFDDIGEGRRAFVVIASDNNGVKLLSGCIEADLDVDVAPVEVLLSFTSEYHDATDGVDLACDNAMDKCTRGC